MEKCIIDCSCIPVKSFYRRKDKLSAADQKCKTYDQAKREWFCKKSEKTINKSLEKLRLELPEVNDFIEEFIPSYGKTLDELS